MKILEISKAENKFLRNRIRTQAEQPGQQQAAELGAEETGDKVMAEGPGPGLTVEELRQLPLLCVSKGKDTETYKARFSPLSSLPWIPG